MQHTSAQCVYMSGHIEVLLISNTLRKFYEMKAFILKPFISIYRSFTKVLCFHPSYNVNQYENLTFTQQIIPVLFFLLHSSDSLPFPRINCHLLFCSSPVYYLPQTRCRVLLVRLRRKLGNTLAAAFTSVSSATEIVAGCLPIILRMQRPYIVQVIAAPSTRRCFK